jgi:hypothetical protein
MELVTFHPSLLTEGLISTMQSAGSADRIITFHRLFALFILFIKRLQGVRLYLDKPLWLAESTPALVRTMVVIHV